MTNYAAPCPHCGAYAVVADGECWRCETNLVPGCPDCRRPVSLGGSLCTHCGSLLKTYALVRPWTRTA